MSTPQLPRKSAVAWEYRRAYILPDDSLRTELSGDQLTRCIGALEARQCDAWQIVRVKLLADNQGRSWFDVLLKRNAQAGTVEPEPAGEAFAKPLRIFRAA